MNKIVSSLMTNATAFDQEGVVARYLETLRIRNLRSTTIYSRQRALARLSLWAGGPILYLDEDNLIRWQAERSREIQPEPLRTEMSHARQFYRWAVREQYRRDDPMARLDLPRVARRLPRPIPEERLAAALAGADVEMRVLLSLAAFAGLRACEIAGLDWSEIGLTGKHHTLRVTEGKGGHSRIVPLSSVLITELTTLPHRRGPIIRRSDGRAGRVTAHPISARANLYLHGCGLDETLHQIRHRFATVTYQACHDIRAVQEMLGHASPTTTSIYAMAASAVSIDAVEAAGVVAA